MPITTSYLVEGMTCAHCVAAVRAELSALDRDAEVDVDLKAGGTSTVRVTSADRLPRDQVEAALEEAGDYRLVAGDG